MKELIIIGAGNVGGFLALNQNLFDQTFNVLGFLDDDPKKHGKNFWGLPVLGNIEDVVRFKESSVAVGISSPLVKKDILKRIGKKFEFPNFISRNAWVSNRVKLGKGVIVYPNVSINHESIIQDFVIINMNCSIGHDCLIGMGSALAPGVNFGGFTNLGQFVDIGIGVSTIQQIKIGDEAKIGGQTMLISDVEPFTTYVGIPGKRVINS